MPTEHSQEVGLSRVTICPPLSDSPGLLGLSIPFSLNPALFDPFLPQQLNGRPWFEGGFCDPRQATSLCELQSAKPN